MGGYGSGRRIFKKLTVEDCWPLDAAKLFQHGYPANALTWTNSRGVQTLAAACWYDWEGDTRVLHLHLKVGDTTIGEMAIRLVSTRPHFGGVRWWFRCECGRRSRVLYMRPDTAYFRCRACHDLIYESAQTHDSRVDYLCRNLTALRAALDSGDHSQFFLGFRAYSKLAQLRPLASL